jgi:hypothetical protein
VAGCTTGGRFATGGAGTGSGLVNGRDPHATNTRLAINRVQERSAQEVFIVWVVGV